MKKITIIIAVIALSMTANGLWANDNQKLSTTMDDTIKSIKFDDFKIEIRGTTRETEVYKGKATECGIHLEHYLSYMERDDFTQTMKEIKTNVQTINSGQELYDEMCQLFGQYEIDTWSDFDGKSPEGLYDGSSMSFEAKIFEPSYYDGKHPHTIFARGNNNFPNHYREFTDALYDIFNEAKKNPQMLDIESFKLQTSYAMGYRYVYAGQKTPQGIRLEYYLPVYNHQTGNNDKFILNAIDGDQQRYEEVCRLLTTCQVDTWSDFDGSNPPGLYDGSSMNFEATASCGTRYYGHGSNNFPSGYNHLDWTLGGMLEKTKINSQKFSNGVFEITVPKSWNNLVDVKFNFDRIEFKLPQTKGDDGVFMVIQLNNYEFSNKEGHTKLAKIVNEEESVPYFIEVWDYWEPEKIAEFRETLTTEAQAVIDAYATDKTKIIKSFKATKGYKIVKEGK